MQGLGPNDSLAVKDQYATSKCLDIRISFHDRYSTNRQGYLNWLISNYDIREGFKVLEIGCGSGGLWLGHDDVITRCEELFLTDMSEGMIKTTKENIGQYDNVIYQIEDIQNLSFEDDLFDVVIANSMLYHVPDLDRGLYEVRRVLKDDGIFYCATFGENNFTDILADWFKLSGEDFNPNHNFTMQNGYDKLSRHFGSVTPLIYEDSLHITDMEDLVTYLKSLSSFKAVLDLSDDRIRDILNEHVSFGTIDLPKEYGMFICR